MILLRKFWPYLALVGLLIGAYLWIDSRGYHRGYDARQPEIAALTSTIQDVRAKTAQAKTDDAARAKASEQAQAMANKGSSDAYRIQLAALRARYDALRVRAGTTGGANPGSGGSAAVPGADAIAGGVDGPADSDRLFGFAYAADENTLKLLRLQRAAQARDEAFNAAAKQGQDERVSKQQ